MDRFDRPFRMLIGNLVVWPFAVAALGVIWLVGQLIEWLLGGGGS